MASHDDDTMPEETQGYKLSQPKQSLAEYQQMGAFFYVDFLVWLSFFWFLDRSGLSPYCARKCASGPWQDGRRVETSKYLPRSYPALFRTSPSLSRFTRVSVYRASVPRQDTKTLNCELLSQSRVHLYRRPRMSLALTAYGESSERTANITMKEERRSGEEGDIDIALTWV